MTMVTLAIESPVGTLRLFDDHGALAALSLPSVRHAADADALTGTAGTTPLLERAAAQLAEYFAGNRRAFDLPLAPHGTEFQQRVWRALCAIPFGVTASYGDLARAIDQPSASRAVGAANGRNPIAIIIPCHRVIGANGTLTGYGGGLPTKRWLLDHERGQRDLMSCATLSACSGS